MFSMPDIAVIALVVLFIFGPKKLPEIGSAIGKGIRGFRKAADEGEGLLSEHKEEKTAETNPVETKPVVATTNQPPKPEA
jgi:sec-independent protein translocase protein TatA